MRIVWSSDPFCQKTSFEFIPNGSLDFWIFPKLGQDMPWWMLIMELERIFLETDCSNMPYASSNECYKMIYPVHLITVQEEILWQNMLSVSVELASACIDHLPYFVQHQSRNFLDLKTPATVVP
ncbi:unnamed protein product [Vicia faba]|uniref:Uncharacterized protein n=1 Tax=Vicia faba TaxID=3906 RepID=A0AAV1AL29_VICFA|nr:unnamed protein product [Vicia faba]